MKHFILVLTVLFLATLGFSQDVISLAVPVNSPCDHQVLLESNFRPKRYKPYHWRSTALQTMGVAIGPESLFALKGSILGRYGYSRIPYRHQREITVFGVYGGFEFSMFGLFAIWGSAGLNAGVSIGPLTFDGSLTFWGIAAENKSIGTTTLNPKVGLQVLDYVWLKAGYSYFLRGENIAPNRMKLGDQSVNLELSAVIPL